MTNATVDTSAEVPAPPSTPVEPGAVNMTTNVPLTPEQMRAQVEADIAAEEAKMKEALAKKMAKRFAEIDEKVEEQALAEKRVELARQATDFYKSLIPALGITIPEKGLTLKPTVKIENGPNGTLMVSYTLPEKTTGTAATGTRAPRGSGSGRVSITGITPKIDLYVFAGKEFKTASAILKAIKDAGTASADFGADSPARHIVGWSKSHLTEANLVTVKRTGQPDALLGDLVAAEFPASAPAPATTPPPPPATPPTN